MVRPRLRFHCCWNFASFFGDVFVLVFFLKVMHLSQSWIAVAVSLMWIVRWIMAIPLIQAITNGIDHWADSVHGTEPEQLH